MLAANNRRKQLIRRTMRTRSHCAVPTQTTISTILFLTYKEQMVAHTKEFGLLTDVEMIPQVLLIGSFIQAIDEVLQQFTGTVGCNLVNDLNACLSKKLSAMIRGMEHKGKIIQPKGFLVVVTVHQVIILALLHGQDHHIIGDEGKEYLSIRFAYTLGFFNALKFIFFLM